MGLIISISHLSSFRFGYIHQDVSNWKIVFSTFMLWCSGFLSYNDDLVTASGKQQEDIDVSASAFFTRSVVMVNVFMIECSQDRAFDSPTKCETADCIDRVIDLLVQP